MDQARKIIEEVFGRHNLRSVTYKEAAYEAMEIYRNEYIKYRDSLDKPIKGMNANEYLLKNGFIFKSKQWVCVNTKGHSTSIANLMERYHIAKSNEAGAHINPDEIILQPWQMMSAKQFLNREGINPDDHVCSTIGNISLSSILDTYASILLRAQAQRIKPLPVLTSPKPIFHATLCTAHGINPDGRAEYEKSAKEELGEDYHVIVLLDNSIGNKFQVLSPGNPGFDQPTGILHMGQDSININKLNHLVNDPLTDEQIESIKKEFKNQFGRGVGNYTTSIRKVKIEKAMHEATFIQKLNFYWCCVFNSLKAKNFIQAIIDGKPFKDAYTQAFKYFKP